jgi:hypothetical protein
MELHQIKNLVYNEGNNYQNREAAYRMGENLWQLFVR